MATQWNTIITGSLSLDIFIYYNLDTMLNAIKNPKDYTKLEFKMLYIRAVNVNLVKCFKNINLLYSFLTSVAC